MLMDILMYMWIYIYIYIYIYVCMCEYVCMNICVFFFRQYRMTLMCCQILFNLNDNFSSLCHVIFHCLPDMYGNKKKIFPIHRRCHVIKMQACLVVCSEHQGVSPGNHFLCWVEKPFAWFPPFLWERGCPEMHLIGCSVGATLYKASWIF